MKSKRFPRLQPLCSLNNFTYIADSNELDFTARQLQLQYRHFTK